MDLPGNPACIKVVLRDEPPPDAIRRAMVGIGDVPFVDGELGCCRRGGAEAATGGGGGEVRHGLAIDEIEDQYERY